MKFVNPEIEVVKFNVVDVITASGCAEDICYFDGFVCPANITQPG